LLRHGHWSDMEDNQHPRADLIRAKKALKESEERYRKIFEGTAQGMLVADIGSREFLYANPAICEMLGYTEKEIIRLNVDDIHPQDSLAHVVSEFEAQARGEKTLAIDVPCLRKNGKTIYADINTAKVIIDGKECNVGMFTDTTERRRAQEEIRALNLELDRRVRERTTELEATNRELESFAYSVSHDLRAPLRAIDGFSQALLEEYSGSLNGPGRNYLDRVSAAARRMALLIEDLLRLSRVTRVEMRRERVDLSAAAREIAAELRATQPERETSFVIADGVQAWGDPPLLRLALQSLLDNAWKFSETNARATIEFGCVERNDQTAYFVGDDGVGFDMTYAGKLFAPFQRLHSRREFPGTGIGLATVQRIVHRHGGRAWGRGQVDRGATFYFTLLPKRPDRPRE